MTSPAQDRGQRVRRTLLDTTSTLIAELGWSAVSTRILAERAKVSPSVVHYHFASIQALRREAVIELVTRLIAELDAVLGEAITADEAVHELLGLLSRYSGTDHSSVLAIEGYLAASRDEQLHNQIAQSLAQFRARLATWLGDRFVPCSEATASILFACLDGLLLHRGLGQAGDPDELSAVLCRLLRPTPDKSN